MNKEIWKAIPGYEGYYEVSDLGRVRSVDREEVNSNGVVRKLKGKILKQRIGKINGRLLVNLNKDGKCYTKKPHVLVALAFIGERPEGYHICHIDGDYTNNKLSNIRYDTAGQNAIDVYRYGGKRAKGKLTTEQVLEIRKLYATGDYKQVELAEIFDVTQTQVSKIVLRASYSYLNDDGTIDESHTAVS